MLWFLGSLVIFLSIAVIMLLTGFLILNLFRKNQTTRLLSFEEISLAALIGTAFWGLLSGALSYLGLNFNQIRLALIPVLIFIGLFFYFRRSIYRFHALHIRKISILFMLAFLAGSISLLPLILKNTFYFIGDAFTYITIGDFLQTHNFITPIQSDASSPYLHQAISHQYSGLRMGANFFLALITSWTVGLKAIDIYPAVLAWGVALNLFSMFLWMRWGFRASYRIIVLALFFLAVTPNSIQVSGVLGFFPQTFGTAIFFFAIAVLTRAVRASRFTVKLAILLGFSWAFLLSFYSELFPFLGLVSIVSFSFAFLRSHKKKQTAQFLKMLFFSLAIWVVLSHYELYRFSMALPIQLNSYVGWSIPPNFLLLWNTAIAAKPLEASWNWGFVLAGVILSSLFLGGLWRVIITKQIVPLAVFSVFFAVAAYYWSISDISNTQEAMWSVYKISQWSSPLLVSLAFLGLQPFKLHKIFNIILVIFCLAGTISLAFIFNERVGIMETYAGSKNPVQEYSQLAQIIKKYNKPMAYQVSPAKLWPSLIPMYFSMNSPLQGTWNVDYMPHAFIVNELPATADTFFYCLACPFPNPLNPLLPANAVHIQQPVVYEFENQTYRQFPYKLLDSQLTFPVSRSNRVCLSIFSLQSGNATIEFSARATKGPTPEPIIKIHNKKGWQYKPIELIKKNQKFKIPISLILGGDNPLCFEVDHTISISVFALYNNP